MMQYKPGMIMGVVLAAGALIGASSTGAQARGSLRDVPKLEQGLFSIAVADKIRKECSDISARMLRALRALRSLESHARGLGYSEAEIKAYVKSDAEKRRMKIKRDTYLAGRGVVKSDPATYCAVGHAEIENSSQIGALLKAR